MSGFGSAFICSCMRFAHRESLMPVMPSSFIFVYCRTDHTNASIATTTSLPFCTLSSSAALLLKIPENLS